MSTAVVGEPSLVAKHGSCVSVVVSDLPSLHPWAVEGRVKLLVPQVGTVLVQLGSLQHPSSCVYGHMYDTKSITLDDTSTALWELNFNSVLAIFFIIHGIKITAL